MQEERRRSKREKAAASPFPSAVPEPQLLASGVPSAPSHPEISVAFPPLELFRSSWSQDSGPLERKEGTFLTYFFTCCTGF